MFPSTTLGRSDIDFRGFGWLGGGGFFCGGPIAGPVLAFESDGVFDSAVEERRIRVMFSSTLEEISCSHSPPWNCACPTFGLAELFGLGLRGLFGEPVIGVFDDVFDAETASGEMVVIECLIPFPIVGVS